MAKTFTRYQWLIATVQRLGPITLRDLDAAWRRSSLNDGHLPLSERTLQRHKSEIADIFGIEIRCDKGTNTYYIENEEEVETGGVRDWMLSTVAVDNMLNESRDLRDRIQFESIPSGQAYLQTIIDAMRSSRCLVMKYRSFWSDECYTVTFSPYFLKVFAQRWYVIGTTDRHEEPRTYALDRILELGVSERTFRYPKRFSPAEYFADSFGIFHSEQKPERVRLRVTRNQEKYFRSLPLHSSQREVETGDGYAVFEYRLSPAVDFVQELMSKGPSVEVLEPEWLRAEVASQVSEMAKMYAETKYRSI